MEENSKKSEVEIVFVFLAFPAATVRLWAFEGM
jgi:hypothetical protein